MSNMVGSEYIYDLPASPPEQEWACMGCGEIVVVTGMRDATLRQPEGWTCEECTRE